MKKTELNYIKNTIKTATTKELKQAYKKWINYECEQGDLSFVLNDIASYNGDIYDIVEDMDDNTITDYIINNILPVVTIELIPFESISKIDLEALAEILNCTYSTKSDKRNAVLYELICIGLINLK